MLELATKPCRYCLRQLKYSTIMTRLRERKQTSTEHLFIYSSEIKLTLELCETKIWIPSKFHSLHLHVHSKLDYSLVNKCIHYIRVTETFGKLNTWFDSAILWKGRQWREHLIDQVCKSVTTQSKSLAAMDMSHRQGATLSPSGAEHKLFRLHSRYFHHYRRSLSCIPFETSRLWIRLNLYSYPPSPPFFF